MQCRVQRGNLAPLKTFGRRVAIRVQANPYRDTPKCTTKLVSITRQGTGGSVADLSDYYLTGHKGWISDDGRYVTFIGLADEYVADDHNNQPDLFQRDLVTGTTGLVSPNLLGTGAGNAGTGSNPWNGDFVVTPTGRYVVFTSDSSDLVRGDNNQKNDCFVRDTVSGKTVSISGKLPRSANLSLVKGVDISPDGRYVFFNLVDQPNGSTAIECHAFLYDLLAGQMSDLSAPAGNYLGEVDGVGFSPDGGLFVFEGNGKLLPIDNNDVGDVFAVRLDSPVKNRSGAIRETPVGEQ